MDSLPRPRQRRVHFPAYTTFACVLAGAILLALVAAAVTKKFVYRGVQLPELRHGPLPFLQEYEPNFTFKEGNATGCTSHTCEWNTAYIFKDRTRHTEACSDFYLHACSQSWYSKVDHKRRPYREFSAGQLMVDIEYFFKRFLALKGNHPFRPDHNFLVQALWVYDRCKALPNESVVPTVERVMRSLRLSGWPFREFKGDLTFHVAIGDRLMKLQSLFDVVFRKHTGTGLSVFLRAPKTLYRRYMVNGVVASDETYIKLVASALERYTKMNATAMATGIFRLEKTLEDMALADAEEFMMPTPTKVAVVDDIFLGTRWNWTKYLNILFAGEFPASNQTMVVVEDPVFFRNLGNVFDTLSDVAILNYMGYKALVELSPFLGEHAEFLTDISHEYDIAGLSSRQVACMALLEKLYRYGLGIAAKLTLGKEFATTYRTHLDSQLAFFFTLTRNVLVQLVQSHRSWIDPIDSGTAVHKLNSMHFTFGTQGNLVDYEQYRQTASVPIGGEDENALEAVFKIYSYASSLYWDVRRPSSQAFDNVFSSSLFIPGYEYHDTDNALFLPHGVIGFLNHVSNQIHPVLYPAVLVHLLRGVLTALSKSASFSGRELRSWWSVSTTESYDNISRCLQAQYVAPLDEREAHSSQELNFIDNAVLYPLFVIYKSSARKLNFRGVHIGKSGARNVSAEQFFFYNYAAAHCERADNSTWQNQIKFRMTPARWRLNVPLRNFPAFSETFGCDRMSYMNPTSKCSVWKSAEAA